MTERIHRSLFLKGLLIAPAVAACSAAEGEPLGFGEPIAATTSAPLPAGTRVFDIRDFGAIADGGVTNNQGPIQSAINAAEAAGGGIVYVPASAKYFTCRGPLTIKASGVRLVGDGPGASRLDMGFATGAAILLQAPAGKIIENVGVESMTIAHSKTRTAGPTIFLDRTQRAVLFHLDIDLAYIGVQIGRDMSIVASGLATIITRMERVRLNTSFTGVQAVSTAALWMNQCQLNGTPGKGSVGVEIGCGGTGGFDSVWLTSTTIEEHDTGVLCNPAGGSVANIWANGLYIDRPRAFGIRLSPTGAGQCNQHVYQHVNVWGAAGVSLPGGGSAAFYVEQAGSASIRRVSFMGCSAADLPQRFMYFVGAASDITIAHCMAKNGSLQSAGVYPGIDLAGPVQRVSITGNNVSGGFSNGLVLSATSRPLVATGNMLAGNVGPGVLDRGAAAQDRQLGFNVG